MKAQEWHLFSLEVLLWLVTTLVKNLRTNVLSAERWVTTHPTVGVFPAGLVGSRSERETGEHFCEEGEVGGGAGVCRDDGVIGI